jgi:putative transposase
MVSRSGYYQWCTHQRCPSDHARRDAQLRVQIEQVYRANEAVYGSPRITRALVAQGVPCGRRRVARLMRLDHLVGRPKRRFRIRTTDSRHAGPIAPQRLLNSAPPTRPDQIWVTDITYVRILTSWVYLAAVMDLCTRRIVGWALAPTLDTALVLAAFDQAVQQRKPPAGLIVHSDRGSQFASAEFRHRLADHHLLASMSRRANCYDNAAMESFWSTLKMECLFRSRFPNAQAARQTLFRYIESFYNSRRLHSALGYHSPLDFEALLT